jgi:hypothetical protein
MNESENMGYKEVKESQKRKLYFIAKPGLRYMQPVVYHN